MTQQAVLVERETECHAVSVAEGQAFVERQAGEPLQVAQVLTAEDVKVADQLAGPARAAHIGAKCIRAWLIPAVITTWCGRRLLSRR